MSDTVLAAAPIIAVLVFMVGLGWSAVRAGLVAAAGTVVIALTVFDFAGDPDTFGPVAGVTGLVAEAAWVTLTVVAIIGPALAVYELQQRTNTTDVLQTGLSGAPFGGPLHCGPTPRRERIPCTGGCRTNVDCPTRVSRSMRRLRGGIQLCCG